MSVISHFFSANQSFFYLSCTAREKQTTFSSAAKGTFKDIEDSPKILVEKSKSPKYLHVVHRMLTVKKSPEYSDVLRGFFYDVV